ncbi:MAG TPA: WS/DGAT domain-containing protein, partial [Candidatus Binataceae bacterium]|nr:WS/DGAT domain-containing protein [Candidatus Binataceae bacterium]
QALEALMSMTAEIPPTLVAAGTRVTRTAIEAGGALMKLTGWRPRAGGLGLSPLGINFVATNVPGVQIPLYMNGHMCLDMLPLVPLGATLGFGVAILSYYGSLYFGMIASPAVMPDVDLMKRYVEEAFADLKQRSEDQTTGKPHIEKEIRIKKQAPVKALRAAARR